MVITDNGTGFVSSEFEQFLKSNGVKHTTSAPYHPASNGLAERAVQIVKKGLKKRTTGTMSSRLAKILFNYRISPQTTTGTSPAELLLGRRPLLKRLPAHHQLSCYWAEGLNLAVTGQKASISPRSPKA